MPNCRPSSKAAESQRKKPQKKQTPPARTRDEEEADEEEDDEEQNSPSTKNQKHEPAGKFSKRRVTPLLQKKIKCINLLDIRLDLGTDVPEGLL